MPLDAQTDALATAKAIRSGEVSPREAVQAAIDRIVEADRALKFLVAERFEEALAEADAVDPAAPLAGVPILTKDFLATVAGVPQTEGSRYIRDWVPAADSEYVARLRRSGAIILGTTTTAELALASTTETSRYGQTGNPAAPGRIPGGSSGGAGSAVASGAVPVAHGSDAAGSIRIPSSVCGLVGLKPTRARNPLGPAHGDMAAGIWVEHVLSRSVRDSAVFLDLTHGPMPGDPYPAPVPARSFSEAAAADPPRLRIAWATVTPAGMAVDPACALAVERTAAQLEALGHDVVAGSPAFDVAGAEDDFFTLFCVGHAARIELWTRRLGRAPHGDDLDPYTWGLLERGRAVSGAELLGVIDRLQGASRQVAAFFGEVDVWLTPTLSLPPVPLGYFDVGSGETAADSLARDAHFTAFLWLANMTGQPALSYPAHRAPDGAPIGVQFVGRYGDEATLLSIAGALERAAPITG